MIITLNNIDRAHINLIAAQRQASNRRANIKDMCQSAYPDKIGTAAEYGVLIKLHGFPVSAVTSLGPDKGHDGIVDGRKLQIKGTKALPNYKKLLAAKGKKFFYTDDEILVGVKVDGKLQYVEIVGWADNTIKVYLSDNPLISPGTTEVLIADLNPMETYPIAII